jgi:enterochelin esterase-like enzyme
MLRKIHGSNFIHIKFLDRTIDLLIDQQSVGKRSLHLMDTVNAKKRWATIYWCVIFEREPHRDPLC